MQVYVQDRLVEHGARICKWLLSVRGGPTMLHQPQRP